MAVDEAILEAVRNQRQPPTVRFYAWDPPCLSIGYAQSVGDTDQEAIGREGWDLVRRPTGGKAILHTDEITYSIVAPADHPLFVNGVLPSYERISLALISGLKRVGLEPELHVIDDPINGNPICFQNPGAFEITFDGKKLVGSAQLRRMQGVLQHGSIPLQGELGRICLGLRYASEADRRQAMQEVGLYAITLERALGETPTWDKMASYLAAGMEETLGLHLDREELSPDEINRSQDILEERHSHPDWTHRK